MINYFRINRNQVFAWSGVMQRAVHNSDLIARASMDATGQIVYASRTKTEDDICKRYGILVPPRFFVIKFEVEVGIWTPNTSPCTVYNVTGADMNVRFSSAWESEAELCAALMNADIDPKMATYEQARTVAADIGLGGRPVTYDNAVIMIPIDDGRFITSFAECYVTGNLELPGMHEVYTKDITVLEVLK